MRTAATLFAGILIGTMLLTPAGAHVGGTVSHLWQDHIKPRVRDDHYTKAQSNDRYYTKTQSHTNFLEPTIQPNETVRGTIGEKVRVDAAGELGFNASLPRPAPVALDDDHVTIDGVDEASGECPGTAANPTAAPGYVCIYEWFSTNTTPNGGYIWGGGAGDKWGFQASVDADAAGSATWFANWAYRAPV